MKDRAEPGTESTQTPKEFQTLTQSYLMTEQGKLNGVLPRLYNYADYNEFSKPTDDIDISTGAPVAQVTGLPDPIAGKRIRLPDGSALNPALSWVSDTDTGWYFVGAANPGAVIGATLVYDWNASRLRLATGYRLYLGATADIQSANSDRLCIEDSETTQAVSATIRNTASGSNAHGGWIARSDEGNNAFYGIMNTGYNAVSSMSPGELSIHLSGSTNRGINILNRTNSYIRFGTNDTEKMRLLANGALIVGGTTQVGSETLRVAGSIVSGSLANTGIVTVDSVGTLVTNASALSYASGQVRITSTAGSQLRLAYDSSIYAEFTTQSAGYFDLTPPDSGNQFRVIKSLNGARLYTVVSNQTNAASSDACFYAGVAGTSSGDPFSTWQVPGGGVFSAGIDNSVSGDPWKLSADDDLGTNDILTVTSGGLSTWNRSDTATTPTHDLIQGSTGDAAIRYAIGSTNSFAIGIDNSDSDSFKVSYANSGSAALGTNDRLTISTAGLVTITQYANVGTTTDAAAQGDFAAGATQKLFYDESLGFLQLTSTVSKQLRLAYTSGSVYADLRTDTDGFLNITSTGEGVIVSGAFLDVTGTTSAIYASYSASVYTQLNTDSSGNFLITPTGPDVAVSKSVVGSDLRLVFFNTDNTDPASGARLQFAVGGASAGDPQIRFLISGVNQYSVGIDNSDADTFKISGSGALGTLDYLTVAIGGDIGIGTSTFPSAGSGKVLVFGDNAAQPTMGTNTAGVYAYDSGTGTVELYGVDEAGNDTQLTPHNNETGEWWYNSRNRKTGKTLRVHMERLVKYLVEKNLVPPEFVEETNA